MCYSRHKTDQWLVFYNYCCIFPLDKNRCYLEDQDIEKKLITLKYEKIILNI
jgi:hypothetical protein